MNDKHTPGPWRANTAMRNYPEVTDPDGHALATMWIGRNGEQKANARLIAAAPSLVEPWQNVDNQDWDYLLSLIPDGGRGRFWKEVFAKHRAAIARATGSETREG